MHDPGESLEAQSRFRILSLDGGGVKGAYTASVLHKLEELSGKSISDHFDLITGTSTGGIIAIAIGLGVPLEKIVELYVENGPVIFRKSKAGLRGTISSMIRVLRRAKHSQAVLRDCLEQVLESRRFGESKNRLVIPAFNAVNGNIQLFKTAHRDSYRMDYRRPACEIALATSAAPTYFDAFEDKNGAYLDGGVWANSPVMVGIVEATSALGLRADQIDVLSIGTTSAPFDVNHQRRKGGIWQWGVGVVDLLMEAQTRGMQGLAFATVGQNLLRIDEVTRPGRFSLDGAHEVADLKALGENSARRHLDQVVQKFLLEPAAPFKPFHAVELVQAR
jgi:patatin-like phospholipase/acyl hydrolase